MPRFQQNNYSAFPNLDDTKILLDLVVLSDIKEVNDEILPCFALGEKQDLSSGNVGFSFTPYFDSMLDLDDFCKKNMNKIEDIATKLEAGEPYPTNEWLKGYLAQSNN